MKHILPEHTMLQLSKFIADKLALHFPIDRWENLERNISTAAKEFGNTDEKKFVLALFVGKDLATSWQCSKRE